MSVIINQVFALGLPCADDNAGGSGLSTGAKAGIGVGAGVVGLLLISSILFLLVRVGKKRLRRRQPPPPLNTGYHQPQEKHMSTSTGAMPSPFGPGSSHNGHGSSQLYPESTAYGFSTSPALGLKQSHASWGSQPTINVPPQYRPPVEMQAPQRYEIGNDERAASPRNQDMISGEESNAPTSSVSAYETQRERLDRQE